jgi:seryl-tRNA synthetase
MIDINLLRDNPAVRAALLKKEPNFNIDQLLSLDLEVRQKNSQIEALRAQKNSLAEAAKAGITPEIREQSIVVGQQIKNLEQVLEATQIEFEKLALGCPNVPQDIVPEGFKESNKVIKEWGTKPEFDFPIKKHMELGEALGWFDFKAATRMTAARFALYQGDAVKLVYSLMIFMLKNNIKHGFTPIMPPFLVNEKSLEVASNFPKFRDQVFSVCDDLYLTPTSEVNLTNIYRDQILTAEQLPIRMTAWTSCFRREAGTYGAAEQGLIRIHQFEKVELYTICEPEHSETEQLKMLKCAEEILQKLGLHYRISLLAAQDCSFASAKTFDIEVWMPGQNAYYEVSSCSNCTDFQSRRGKIRYKKHQQDATKLVHTLNCSSLALPRLMVALMETYQQPDGSIKFPDAVNELGLF